MLRRTIALTCFLAVALFLFQKKEAVPPSVLAEKKAANESFDQKTGSAASQKVPPGQVFRKKGDGSFFQKSEGAALLDSTLAAPESPTEAADPGQPRIYFTIDDGPSNFSNDVLELAQAEQVPLTVFLVGFNCYSPERAAMVDAYHASPLVEVGNHSYCHAHNDYDNWYLSPAEVLRDFEKNGAALLLKNKLARLPGRAAWDLDGREKCNYPNGGSSAKLLGDHGYRVFGWDVEWPFDRKTGLPKGSPEAVMADIERHLRTGEVFTQGHAVLLLHERHFQKKEEVRRLVQLLKKAGYRFSFLREYPREA